MKSGSIPFDQNPFPQGIIFRCRHGENTKLLPTSAGGSERPQPENEPPKSEREKDPRFFCLPFRRVEPLEEHGSSRSASENLSVEAEKKAEASEPLCEWLLNGQVVLGGRRPDSIGSASCIYSYTLEKLKPLLRKLHAINQWKTFNTGVSAARLWSLSLAPFRGLLQSVCSASPPVLSLQSCGFLRRPPARPASARATSSRSRSPIGRPPSGPSSLSSIGVGRSPGLGDLLWSPSLCLCLGGLLQLSHSLGWCPLVFVRPAGAWGVPSSPSAEHSNCLLYCLWVIVPCGRGSPGWSLWVGQPLHLGVSPLLGVLRGFVTFFGLSLLFASDGASGGVRDSLGLGRLVLVRAVRLFRYRFHRSSAQVVRHTSALRWSSSRLRGFRLCFPLRERLPLLGEGVLPALYRAPLRYPARPFFFLLCELGLRASLPPAYRLRVHPLRLLLLLALVQLWPPLFWPLAFRHPHNFCTDLPSLHIQPPRLSRDSPHYPASLPLPPVSLALPHIPCVDSFSPALRSDLASASTPPSSPAQFSGATTRPVVCHSVLDRLPPVAPLLDAELGISLPDALAALKVSLPQEQLDLLRSSFVATVAPVSRSSLARLRRELHRIGASATSILPPGAARAARRTSPHHGPSVLIVVETKMSVVSHACVCTLMRQPSFGFIPANETAGGILLAWSPPLTGAVVHIGRYSISASLSGLWPNGPVLVTAVYGPCVGALHGQLWAELHQVRQLAASPWLLAGDFNCLLSPADSSSPVSFGQSMSAFQSFVDEFGLFDVPSTNGTFTWSNNRNPPILRRLDHIFLSPDLFSAFPSSSLDLGPRHLSDHVPLLLSLHRGRAGSGPARFRFELWWLRDESFVTTVPIWWARAVNGRWAAFRLSRKLHFIRRETLAWKRIFWSSKFSEVANWNEEILSLQASDNISVDQSSRLLCLQCLAQEWRIRESIHWQ
ncbi:hypothetical protein EJ110_NYTH20681 [Nymphaea thermarum]|nr:hypothetical protein EJ110_NYTH20681 [Nymphaea thermarum]